MCGLAGFVNFSNVDVLACRVHQIQAHRGPDHHATWTKENTALVHQRLSIIDLSEKSNQPFVKNGLTVILNGEIYNYSEIKKRLVEEKNIEFFTSGDTEVLLESYRAWGVRCLDYLSGMFAFALFDEQSSELIIARDHFGIKPLFYTQIGNCFAFASELKTLVEIPGFDKTINKSALVAAMNYLWVPGNETMFRNCFKLPAAHYMIIDTRAALIRAEPKCYWNLNTDIRYRNENDAVEALTKCFEDSINRHMVADVPVSSFLSGGIDSSLISVMASKFNPGISTYTIATSARDKKVEQMPEDEKYARQLAENFRFDHHEIEITPDIVSELPKMVYTLDEPIGDPAAINTYLICQAARKKGVKVILSGMGADEIFLGYRRQKAILIASRYQKFPPSLRHLISSVSKRLPVKLFGRGWRTVRWINRFVSFVELPPEEGYMRSYSYYNQSELQQLFAMDITDEYTEMRKKHADLFNSFYKNDLVNSMCFTDIHMFMQGLNLSYTDKASMAASVEVRVPFIDKEVVSLAMSIAGSLKYKNGVSKYVLKKMAEKFLPKQIIYRPKASFSAPIRSWISGELASMVDQYLSKDNIEKRGLFNYDYVKQLIDKDRSGKEDNAYRIYQLLTVELWYRHFVDR
jgi:asparagine synthase (glutamine-hydrolysing)